MTEYIPMLLTVTGVLGVMVSYAAMFGLDRFKEAVSGIEK